VAWGRYSSKKREENRRNRCARVASRWAPTAWAPARTQYVESREDHGRHLGWYKHGGKHGHHDEGDDRERHGEHGHHGD
jgi:hypothetical protein